VRLIATDFITHYRPTVCDLRVFLREKGEDEAKPGPFDEVLHRLGLRHEREHLATLGAPLDLSEFPFDERIRRTSEAIADRIPLLYQPAFRVEEAFAETEVEIIGMPDFLILDGDGYLIRDSKLSRRIDQDHHPEILLQIDLYGWLFEKSCGAAPKALQVHSGTGQIVSITYDGGISALQNIRKILTIKGLVAEPYEPVGWSKCNGCGFTDRCWARAEQNSDVALVYGIDQSLARALNNQGVRTRKDLLASFNDSTLSEFKRLYGKGERRVGKAAASILQFAVAMEKQQEQVLCVPAIPPKSNFVMFDLEGMPPYMDELDKIYLWGTQVYGEHQGEFRAALSGFGPTGDNDGWLGFLANAHQIFETYGDIPFVHWAPYEQTYLSRYVERYGDPTGTAARIKANLLDPLAVTKSSIVLPLPSFSLKVVEDYVGFERKGIEFGGQWAMAMFIEATETGDELERKKLMDKIVAYNQEDLEAMWAVFRWLRSKAPVPS
jgi:predicted RecB family nuclease